jgi:hypothetical protein
MSYHNKRTTIARIHMRWPNADQWQHVGVPTMKFYRMLRQNFGMSRRDANLMAIGHATGIDRGQVLETTYNP